MIFGVCAAPVQVTFREWSRHILQDFAFITNRVVVLRRTGYLQAVQLIQDGRANILVGR